jgi:hypothetical protein
MPFPTASSLYAANLLAAWGASATDIDLDSTTPTNRIKVALYNDSMNQDPLGTTPLGYSTTGELLPTGGSNYTTGGNPVGTVTWAVNGGLLVCSAASTVSWASAQFSNVYGCVVYDDGATSPVADACIVAVRFGTVGSSGGGTFTIDWADLTTPAVNNVIFTIDPQP